jgi:glutamate synthase (NADPH/NADH) small chain
MDLKLEIDKRGSIIIDGNMMTCLPGIFAAGDAELGASLVVRAIYSGRQAAEGVQRYLTSDRLLSLRKRDKK